MSATAVTGRSIAGVSVRNERASTIGRSRYHAAHGRLHAHGREPARPGCRPRLRRGGDPAPHPRVGQRRRLPAEPVREDGRAGLPRRADPGGLRRRRDGLRQLRAPVRGAGACRHRVPCRPERARRAQLAGTAPVGDRGAAAALARPPGQGREARDVRSDGARRRHGCRQPRRRRPVATAPRTD